MAMNGRRRGEVRVATEGAEPRRKLRKGRVAWHPCLDGVLVGPNFLGFSSGKDSTKIRLRSRSCAPAVDVSVLQTIVDHLKFNDHRHRLFQFSTFSSNIYHDHDT